MGFGYFYKGGEKKYVFKFSWFGVLMILGNWVWLWCGLIFIQILGFFFFMMGGCCRLWSTTNHMCQGQTSHTLSIRRAGAATIAPILLIKSAPTLVSVPYLHDMTYVITLYIMSFSLTITNGDMLVLRRVSISMSLLHRVLLVNRRLHRKWLFVQILLSLVDIVPLT